MTERSLDLNGSIGEEQFEQMMESLGNQWVKGVGDVFTFDPERVSVEEATNIGFNFATAIYDASYLMSIAPVPDNDTIDLRDLPFVAYSTLAIIAATRGDYRQLKLWLNNDVQPGLVREFTRDFIAGEIGLDDVSDVGTRLKALASIIPDFGKPRSLAVAPWQH